MTSAKDNRTTELQSLSKLKIAGRLRYWRGTIEIPETELHAICDEIQAEHDQAIVATLADDDYELKMDALLCRLTNGKFSKSRAYDLDFMESCVNEEFEILYADELNATLGGGECKVVASSTDGLTTDNPKQLFELSCGHAFKIYGLDVPVACPVCGKAVKR